MTAPPSGLRRGDLSRQPRPVPAMVATDVAEALAAAEGGADVVLVAGADDAATAREAASALAGPAGRLAVLIGDPTVEEDILAARAMAAEVFGRPPSGRGGGQGMG